jgi:hypothetical protein
VFCRRYPVGVEIEVRQRGGVLGLDRRYLVKDGTIEVIDKGRSRGAKTLAPEQAARIHELAHVAKGAQVKRTDVPISDDMETEIDIRGGAGADNLLRVRTGAAAPPEVWDLIGEVSRASDA